MKKKFVIASIFDSNFLPQALVFYDSVKRFVENYQVFFLCLDDNTYDTLRKFKLKGVTLIRHDEFADEELKRLKKERKAGEYSWTCKAPLVQYLFFRYKIKEVTYLDIDMCFWSNPSPIYRELGKISIGITEQRLSPRYKLMEKRSGIFNAGFIYFRNDQIGKKCLDKWNRQCRDWCYSRLEKGKLGDQMYLNEWPELYGKKLKILSLKGVNAACFNTDGYSVDQNKLGTYIDGNKLILFHYHGFSRLGNNKYLTNEVFRVSPKLDRVVFRPYAKQLDRYIRKIGQEYQPLVNKKGIRKKTQSFLYRLILDMNSWKSRL
jgi:hypothetical protein